MAKANYGKPKSNKSQAVREALAENPRAKSKDIVALLAEKGVRVTPSLVYMVKGRQKSAKRRVKRQRTVEHARVSGLSNPIQLLTRVKQLAQEAGGLQNLKQFVDMLAE